MPASPTPRPSAANVPPSTRIGRFGATATPTSTVPSAAKPRPAIRSERSAADEQNRKADARDRAAELREAAHRTITAARSTWPCSATVRVYRPRIVDAFKRSTGPAANDFRRPSFQV